MTVSTHHPRAHRAHRSLSEPGTQLAVLALGLVAAMSPWFATAAVAVELQERWSLGRVELGWLTIIVQLGFVAGALVSVSTGLADRVPGRRLILLGAIGAAVATAAVVLVDDYGAALVARGLTGAFLAVVYPPAMKVMSGWYRSGRGLALGVMVGALTLGSALPHLVNAAGGLGWRGTLLTVSAVTLAGGVAVERLGRDGPHGVPRSSFDPGQVGRLLGNREFRLASIGYFGHMWELYAMWAWISAFYGDVFTSGRAASLAAFAVIGIGAVGSVYAGRLSDRVGRSQAAATALRWSAAAAVVTGFLVDAPWPVVLGAGLVWGFWVVADSAQFSTIVTEVTEPDHVGTALTVQLAAGFVLTVFTIFLVPVVRDAHGWGWAFLVLAPGPIVGAAAMRALRTPAGGADGPGGATGPTTGRAGPGRGLRGG